jgi:hypothetical protein
MGSWKDLPDVVPTEVSEVPPAAPSEKKVAAKSWKDLPDVQPKSWKDRPDVTDPDEADAFVSNIIHGATQLPALQSVEPEIPFDVKANVVDVIVPGSVKPPREETTGVLSHLKAGVQNLSFGLAPRAHALGEAVAEHPAAFAEAGAQDPYAENQPDLRESSLQNAAQKTYDDKLKFRHQDYTNAAEDHPISGLIIGAVGPNIAAESLKGVLGAALVQGGASGWFSTDPDASNSEKAKNAALSGVFSMGAAGLLHGAVKVKNSQAGQITSRAISKSLPANPFAKVTLKVGPHFPEKVLDETLYRSETDPLLPPRINLKIKTKEQLLTALDQDPDAVPRTTVDSAAKVTEPLVAGLRRIDGQLRVALVGLDGKAPGDGVRVFSSPFRGSQDLPALEKMLTEGKAKGLLLEVPAKEWAEMPAQTQHELSAMWRRVVAAGRKEADNGDDFGPQLHGDDSTVQMGRDSVKTKNLRPGTNTVISPTSVRTVAAPTNVGKVAPQSTLQLSSEDSLVKFRQENAPLSGKKIETDPRYGSRKWRDQATEEQISEWVENGGNNGPIFDPKEVGDGWYVQIPSNGRSPSAVARVRSSDATHLVVDPIPRTGVDNVRTIVKPAVVRRADLIHGWSPEQYAEDLRIWDENPYGMPLDEVRRAAMWAHRPYDVDPRRAGEPTVIDVPRSDSGLQFDPDMPPLRPGTETGQTPALEVGNDGSVKFVHAGEPTNPYGPLGYKTPQDPQVHPDDYVDPPKLEEGTSPGIADMKRQQMAGGKETFREMGPPREGASGDEIEHLPPEPPKPPGNREPMPPPPPPGPSPKPVAEVDRLGNMIDKAKGFGKQFNRLFNSDHARGGLDRASLISDKKSVKNLLKAKTETLAALESQLGKKKVTQFRQDVKSYFERNMTSEQMAEQHPEMWNKLRDQVDRYMVERDDMHKWFVDHGYLDSSTLVNELDDAFESYAAREYMAHLVPDYANKVLKKDTALLADSVKQLRAHSPKKYQRSIWDEPSGKWRDWTDEEIKADIFQALGSEDPAALLLGSGYARKGNPATGALKARKDLPEWYKKMLGENRDGLWAISSTLAKQRALKQNFEIWENVVQGGYARDVPLDQSWIRLPEDTAQFGKAAGKYVDPDFYDSMVHLPNVKYEGPKLVNGLVNVMKTNQISLGTARMIVNMFADNTLGGMLAGGVDPTRPVRTWKGMQFAFNAIREFKNDPSKNNSFVNWMKDMRRIGVDAPGHVGGKIDAVNRKRIADAMSDIGASPNYETMMQRLARYHQTLGKYGSAAVDWVDRVHKIASARIIYEDLMKMPEQKLMQLWGETPSRLMSRDEMAKRIAARRIFESYAMYDRLPPATEAMRSSFVGLVAPYSTFAMERARIWGSLPARLAANRDPGLKWRLAKYAALGGLMWGGQKKLLEHGTFGVTQADVDMAMEARRGTPQEKLNPEPWIFPAKIGDDVVVMDMTQWMGPLSYLQGSPDVNAVGRIAWNAAYAPLSGGALGMGVDALAEKAGAESLFPSRTAMPGTAGAAAAGDFLAKAGAIPRIITDTYGNMKKTGAMGTLGMRRDEQNPIAMAARSILPIEQTINLDAPKGTLLGRKLDELKQVDEMINLIIWAKSNPDAAPEVIQKVVQTLGGNTTPQNVEQAARAKLVKLQEDFARLNEIQSRRNKEK